MNNLTSSPSDMPVQETEEARNATRTAWIVFIGGTITTLFFVFLAWQTQTWQLTAGAGVMAIFEIGVLVSLRQIQSGRQSEGLWIIIVGLYWIILGGVFLIAGVGILYAVVLVALVFAVSQALPPQQSRWALFISLGIAVIAISSDLVGLNYRLPAPDAIRTFVPIITGVLVLVFGFLFARQLWAGNLRDKLIRSFLIVAIIPLVIISFITYYSSRTALINDANQKLADSAETTAQEIDTFISTKLEHVRAAGQFPAVIDYLSLPAGQRAGSPEEARVVKFITAMSREDPVFISSVAIYDPKGLTLVDTFPADIGVDKSSRSYLQETLRTGLPFASEVEHSATSNVPSLYFAALAHDASGQVIGLIRIRYAASILQKLIIGDTGLAGASSYAVLLESHRIRLAHGTDRKRVFESIVPLPAALVSDLQAKGFMRPGTPQENATNFADFEAGLNNLAQEPFFAADTNGDSALEQVAVAPLTTKNWSVAFIQSQDVFLAPIVAQTFNNVLVALVVALGVAVAGFFFSQTLAGQIVRLTQTAEAIAGGNIDIQAKVETGDEIGTLAGTFNRMTQQLRDFIATLEERVAERTRNLELAGEVGRAVSQVRALDVLLKDAAELIRKQFDLYYVQVYLTDPSQTNLVLQAGTGQVGNELLARGHRLPLNSASINGRAATEKHSVVISDTTTSATFKPNPLLPNTRSEMAVPLQIGERVVGVLDMQSEIAGSLSTDVLAAFEALAGQMAIAIQNANLLAEAEQSRAEVEKQARRLARAGWVEYLDAIHQPEQTGFVFEKNQLLPFDGVEAPQTQGGANALAASISVTGEQLGELVVNVEESKQTPQTVELVNIVARQVSQQIENLRLLESANRYRAEAEQASRRTTIEGWKHYMEARTTESLSYLYDLNEVRPYQAETNLQTDEQATTLSLKVHDETVGQLSIQGLDPSDTEGLTLATAVAERLSAHLESLRQLEETKSGQLELDNRARQLAAVAEVSTASSRELNVQKMLESVVQLTQRRFGLYHAHVFTFNTQTQALEIAACGWQAGDEHEGTHGTTAIPLAQEQSLVARAARTRQAVIANDVHQEPGWLPNPLLPETASEMAVPLVIGDQLLGVMDVQADHVNAFSTEDANIHTTLASQIATALQNAYSFARAQLQAERETTLNVISQKIQSATSVEAVLQIAARELGHALGAPMTIAQLSMKEKKA